MEKENLVKSSVKFDQEKHRYTLGEKKLNGITAIIERQLFPKKYANIPDSVLEKAAERGHAIHGKIELSMTIGGFDDDADVVNFRSLIGDRKVITTEYLVSDNEHVASMIDGVFDDGSLYDIKTTSSLDVVYLSWQLSIYAYLFELQNGVQAGKLYAIWLPKEQYGKPRMVEVERIDKDEVMRLLECDMKGEQFVPSEKYAINKNVSTDLISGEEVNLIADLFSRLKELEDAKKELQERIKQAMYNNGIKKFNSDKLDITYIEEGTKETFDSKQFKADYPDVYEKYVKTSKVSDSIRIKVK